MASLGFITPYASSQAREDFAETIANYLTRSDESLEMIMWMAAQGWSTGKEDDDSAEEDEKDKIYYSYYYIPNAEDPNKRVYFLTSVEKDSDYLVACVGERGEMLHTVEEVEAYLEKQRELHGTIYPVEDKDQVDGPEVIRQKQSIVRNWFKETWKLDFDELRNIVQRRQHDFDIVALRAEVDAIPVPGK